MYAQNRLYHRKVPIEQVIRAYQISGNELILKRIIQFYTPLIKSNISRVLMSNSISKIPFIQRSDYISIGTYALVTALSRVDTDKYPKFERYLMRYVRGAVIDELRVRGPYKRHSAGNGKPRPQMESLDEVVAELSQGNSPEELAIISERAEIIRRAISELPEREKIAVQAYVYAGMTNRSIAESGILGKVSESMVSKIKNRALRRLTGKLSSLN